MRRQRLTSALQDTLGERRLEAARDEGRALGLAAAIADALRVYAVDHLEWPQSSE
jgi:hypothetical protein